MFLLYSFFSNVNKESHEDKLMGKKYESFNGHFSWQSLRPVDIVAVSEVILLFLPLTESEPGSEGEPRGKEEYTGIKEQWVLSAELLLFAGLRWDDCLKLVLYFSHYRFLLSRFRLGGDESMTKSTTPPISGGYDGLIARLEICLRKSYMLNLCC